MALGSLNTGSTPYRLITKVDTAGPQVIGAASGAISVSLGGSTFSYGAWSQVLASSSSEYLVTAVEFRCSTAVSGMAQARLEIGKGAAGSEVTLAAVPLAGIVGVASASTHYWGGVFALPTPIRVATGSRIAVRGAPLAAGMFSASVDIYLHVTPYSNIEGN